MQSGLASSILERQVEREMPNVGTCFLYDLIFDKL